MAIDWTRLESEISEMGTVVESVVAGYKTVAEGLRNLELRDQEATQKVNSYADQIDSYAGRLAEASKVGTPAESEPAPSTPVENIPPVDGVVTPGADTGTGTEGGGTSTVTNP